MLRCPTHDKPYDRYYESIQGSHFLCPNCVIVPSLPLSSGLLFQLKVEQARNFSPKISSYLASLNSTLEKIQQNFQEFDAMETDMEGRVDVRFEMEKKMEKAIQYVRQLEQSTEQINEMERAYRLVEPSFSPTRSIPQSEHLRYVIDACLLEASLRTFFSNIEGEQEIASLLHSTPIDSSLASPAFPSAPLDLSEKTLLFASENGELEVVRALLDRGDDIHQLGGEHENTPLHCACKAGHLPIVSLLLEKEANINQKNNKLESPLHCTIKSGHLPIASLLLHKGADIHEVDDEGYTPLHYASFYNHLPIVSLLLDRGANINVKNKYSPLHDACRSGFTLIATLLLARGADVRIEDCAQATPLHRACRHGHLPIVSLLLDFGAPIDARRYDWFTPLHSAIKGNYHEVVQHLVDKGANIQLTTKNGRTSFSLAIDFGGFRGTVCAILRRKEEELNQNRR